MRKTFTLAAALCAGLVLSSQHRLRAQSLDPTFLPTVLKAPMTSTLQSGVNTLAVQPDGKILAAGGFDFVNSTLTGKLQRFNTDGTVDATFNVGTGANGFIVSVVVQPDGKILVAGGFNSFNGTVTSTVVRLTATGALDPTFTSPSADVPRQPMSMVLQPDGKILVGGLNSTDFTYPGLVRLNANGTKDTSFTPGGGVDGGFPYALVVQPDGKILVGGSLSTYNGQACGSVLRLNADGTLDTSFSTSGLLTGTVRALLRQANGNILVGGLLFPNGATTATLLLRLLPGGALDNSFTTGTAPTGTVISMVQQSSGAVLLGGSFAQYNGAARGRVARISADGVLDPNFASAAGASSSVLALAETSTGQVLVGGIFPQFNGNSQAALARLSSSGSLDLGFAPLIEARGTVFQALPLSGGQLLVQGNINAVNGTALTGLNTQPRRLNPDGSLDANYTAAVGGTIQGVLATGGAYVLENTASLRRLLPSGSLDNTFTQRTLAGRYGTGSGSGPVTFTGASVQTDGKVLAFGTFTSYDGTPRNGLARLNADGSLDATFTPPASSTLPASLTDFRRVTAVYETLGGKTLMLWSTYNNPSQPFLQRLNADGTLDNTFATGSGPANASGAPLTLGVLPQPDGKVLVWNTAMATFNGQPAPYGLTRLTTTGAVDATFSGLTQYYTPRYVQADGKIVATTGNSTQTNFTSQVVRLNADGSLDSSFAPVAMPSSIFTGDDVLTGVTQQADGKLVLYGSFRYVAGQVRIGLARLTNTTTATKTAAAIQPLTLYPNPAREAATVQLPAGAQQLRLLDLQGRVLQQRPLPARQSDATVQLRTLPAGLYLVQVVGTAGLYQQRLVVTH